jgi:hypothetical protein
MTDKAPKLLLPAGTMMAAVNLPSTDADIVSALRLMNREIAVGNLTQPFDAGLGTIRFRNAFGAIGSPGRMYVLSMADRPIYLPQRTSTGRVVISTTYERGDHVWQRTIIAEMHSALRATIDAATLPDGTCHHARVLDIADRVLAEMRDLVLQTPIRI